LKKRILFIINPVAGVGGKHRIPDRITQHLDTRRFAYEIVNTQGRGHARDLAAEAAALGMDIVAVAGGDGSVNETASGLIGTDTALAIIPLGSGNGLARHLGYSPWLRSTLEVINAANAVSIDVGRVNGEPFFNLIGIGFDAFAVKLFDRERTRGLATYAFAVLRGLRSYDGYETRIEWSGEDSTSSQMEYWTGDAFMLNVCIGSQYGYNFRLAPQARADDGLFEVVLVERFPKRKAAGLVFDLLRERHLENPIIRHWRTDRLHVSTPAHTYLQLDGETRHKGKEFDIRIEPGALRVLVRPGLVV
jgi:YegS/Rv2252/BmrU family lipid kinase